MRRRIGERPWVSKARWGIVERPTTDVENNLDRLPPLSVCLKVRADLHTEAEYKTFADSETTRAVSVWPNYGTFSREDVSSMIRSHEAKSIRVMLHLVFSCEGFCMLK